MAELAGTFGAGWALSQSKATAPEDSLDEICDQIRRLRSSILVPGSHSELAVPTPLAFDSPDGGRDGVATGHAPSYTPSLSASPMHGPRYVSAAEQEPLANFQIPRTRMMYKSGSPWREGCRSEPDLGFHQPRSASVRTNASFSPRAGDIAGGVGGGSQSSSCGAVVAMSPLGFKSTSPHSHGERWHAPYTPREINRSPLRVHHTLWEERQLGNCFRAWRALCRDHRSEALFGHAVLMPAPRPDILSWSPRSSEAMSSGYPPRPPAAVGAISSWEPPSRVSESVGSSGSPMVPAPSDSVSNWDHVGAAGSLSAPGCSAITSSIDAITGGSSYRLVHLPERRGGSLCGSGSAARAPSVTSVGSAGSGGGAAIPMANGHPEELAFSDEDVPVEATTTRVDLCFRVWRRLCAARRAAEIATSVRVLTAQMNRQLRRAVGIWLERSRDRTNQTTVNVKLMTRKLTLRWWRRAARDSADLRALREKTYMVKRCQVLKNSTRTWASHTSSVLMWKSFQHQQKVRRLQVALRAWLLFGELLRKKATDAEASRLILQAVARSAALRWWIIHSRHVGQDRQFNLYCTMRLRLAAKARAWNRLLQYTRIAQRHAGSCSSAQRLINRMRQRATLRMWSRWGSRRVQCERLLDGHRTTRIQPQTMRQALLLWMSAVRREQRHEVALQKAKIVMSLSMKNRTFGGWLFVTHSRARALCVLKGLSFVFTRDILKAEFVFWNAIVEAAKRDRERHSSAGEHDARRALAWGMSMFRESVAIQQAEAIQSEKASDFLKRVVAAQHFRFWRMGVLCQRYEHEQSRRATTHEARRVSARHFVLWQVVVSDIKLEQERERLADGKRADLTARSFLLKWSAYVISRDRKGREAVARRCSNTLRTLRRGRFFCSWSKCMATSRLRAKNALLLTGRCFRSFFAWGFAVAEERRRAQRVRVLLREGVQGRVLRALHDVWRADRTCLASRDRGVVRWALGLWRAVVAQALETAERKLDRGLQLKQRRAVVYCFRGFCAEMLYRRDLRYRLSALCDALEVAAALTRREAQLLGMDSWWSWVESCREVDLAQLAYNLHQQQELCFQCWLQYCEQQTHKRSVHMVCGTYRARRLLRSALECWHGAHLQLCATAEHVLLWAAGLATQRAAYLLWVWHRYVVRRQHCNVASSLYLKWKRVVVWRSWHSAARTQQTIAKILAVTQQARLRVWLTSWSEAASAEAARRYRDAIATQAVRSSRQRQWIERWCEAGRWHRLGHVAEAWDSQVISKHVLVTTLWAWSDAVHLLRRAERLTSRIGERRALAHLRCWAWLARMLDVRPRRLARQGFLWWCAACQRVWAHRLATRRLPLRRGFQQLRAHQQEQAKLRKGIEERCNFLLKSTASRDSRGALRWWRAWSSNAQRRAGDLLKAKEFRKQAQKRGISKCSSALREWALRQRAAKARDAANASKAEQLRQRQRKRVMESWLDLRLHLAAFRFRHHQDMASLRLEGGEASDLRKDVFGTWAEHTKRYLELRARENLVKNRLASSAKVRIFDQWAKVYEHESSSFYATQILNRTKLVRLLASWFRLATFRKRFDVHVSHVQVLQDTQLLRHCFRLWDDNLREHRCIAAVWIDRWRHWSLALVTAWRGVVGDRQRMRNGLRGLLAGTRSMRSRRRADLMRLCKLSSFLRNSFQAWAHWTRKVLALRARTLDFGVRITAGRRLRRLCGWAARAREEQRVASPAGGMDVVWAAWVAAHQHEVSTAHALAEMTSRRNATLACLVMGPWLELALEGRAARREFRAFRKAQAMRRRSRAILTWSSWASAQRTRNSAVLQHCVRRNLQLMALAVLVWRQEARRARVASTIAEARGLHRLRHCWRCWSSAAVASAHKKRCGIAFQTLRVSLFARNVLEYWSVSVRRFVGLRSLVRTLERARAKWVGEATWCTRVANDAAVIGMLSRFVTAFEQWGPAVAQQASLDQGTVLGTIITLIWERQQLSVALGRLKGYPQPWVLGMWSAGDTAVLLPRESPYYAQTELRLAAMVARLEAEQRADRTVSLYYSLYKSLGGGAGELALSSFPGFGLDLIVPNCGIHRRAPVVDNQPALEQRILVWQTLADLVVVYHPGWPCSQVPIGAFARHAPGLQALGRARSGSSIAAAALLPAAVVPHGETPCVVDADALVAAARAAFTASRSSPPVAASAAPIVASSCQAHGVKWNERPPNNLPDADEPRAAVGSRPDLRACSPGWVHFVEVERHVGHDAGHHGDSFTQCRNQAACSPSSRSDATPVFGFRATFAGREPSAAGALLGSAIPAI